MFTGIVQTMGVISGLTRTDESDLTMMIQVSSDEFSESRLGDSISVNGVCLTISEFLENSIRFDVSKETLSATSIGGWLIDQKVNLEKSITATDPLGGHFVLGHVDAVGEVVEVAVEGRSYRININVPAELTRYIANKGSITIDGISLTVNSIDNQTIEYNCVPHTWSVTNVQYYKTGTQVNVEVDLIARYLERLIQPKTESESKEQLITKDLLSEQGFTAPQADD